MPGTKKAAARTAESYAHPEARALLRPDVGTQSQFRKTKLPARYRYDSSLSPALDWDGGAPRREEAEAKLAALRDRIGKISALLDSGGGDLADARAELTAARGEAEALAALSRPFLDWAGKAERLSFDVPTRSNPSIRRGRSTRSCRPSTAGWSRASAKPCGSIPAPGRRPSARASKRGAGRAPPRR